MNKRIKALLFASALAVAGIALGTPLFNLASPILSQGKHAADIHERGVAALPSGDRFHAELHTHGPSAITVQLAAYSVGGHNGWHSHPGLVAVTLTQGSIQWYDENCEPTVYNAGDSWVEGSKVHYFRNSGTGNVQLSAFYITAEGEGLRIDQPAPACATALGLD